MLKCKDKKNFESIKRKITHHRGTPVMSSGDFSAQIFQARREWDHISKVLKEKTANQKYYIQQNCPLEMKEK